jgi:hypothetical protein
VAVAENEHAVGQFGAQGADPAFRDGVGLWAAGRGFDHGDARVGQDRVEGVGELAGPVADQDIECRGALTQIHQEIARSLGGPRAVRVRGDPEQVHVTALQLDHEEHIEPLERDRAVHVGEVAGERGGCVCAQEAAPGQSVPFRRGWYVALAQLALDRGARDPDAEFLQLALDSDVAPARVLSG